MRLKYVVLAGLALYVALSVTDWVMTYTLLRLHPGAVEANPFAAACLERYGWNGLAVYKAGGVIMFVASVFLLARRRPLVATTVVSGGCGVLLAVTVYTHGLILDAHREAASSGCTVWPEAKPADRHDAPALAVPDRCWFATTKPAPIPTAGPAVVLRPRAPERHAAQTKANLVADAPVAPEPLEALSAR